jgi:hypothetical protein
MIERSRDDARRQPTVLMAEIESRIQPLTETGAANLLRIDMRINNHHDQVRARIISGHQVAYMSQGMIVAEVP